MKRLVLVLTAVVATCSFAQFSQQGGKLVGTGSTGSTPEQGSAVALSADGNTAVVGGWDDSAGVGAIWIFTRSGGHWSQQGPKLVGKDHAGTSNQGYSVGISADGNTVIEGGYYDNNRVGAAWVFSRTAGVWSQQGSKLVGNDYVFSFFPASYQGWSVGLSADGNTAIVGGYYDNHATGAAWIYKRTDTVWSQVGSKLVSSYYSGQAQQGYSVAISGDGNTVAVGGNDDAPYYGSAFIYVWNGTSWVEQGNKLVGGNNSAFGSAVALSSDGNTLVVGGSGDYNYASVGAIWVFARNADSTWVLRANELRPVNYTTGTPSIGCSVSLSSDGRTAIVGGVGDSSYAGAAWIFRPLDEPNDTEWSEIYKLPATDIVGTAFRGGSVAISGDGNTAIVGGYADSSYFGAAWIYATPNAPMPVELTTFTASSNSLSVELRWTTATEINNAEFEIERTPSLAGGQWIRVGAIAGAGTSNSPKSYMYKDLVNSPGAYEYRLKQIDRSGAFKYSQEVSILVGSAPAAFQLSQNYPNPFNPTTMFEFSVPTDGRARLQVYNAVGQQVATLFDGTAAAGEYHQVTFDGSHFASGIYFARLQFGDRSEMRKLLLLK
ncbi:MAG TPA: T9SS type A sorting domain-containing protein [Bacteroidota bacterium]|nr:T9SS type A sorting domain-containing protein [Bacteroidota bacterium]